MLRSNQGRGGTAHGRLRRKELIDLRPIELGHFGISPILGSVIPGESAHHRVQFAEPGVSVVPSPRERVDLSVKPRNGGRLKVRGHQMGDDRIIVIDVAMFFHAKSSGGLLEVKREQLQEGSREINRIRHQKQRIKRICIDSASPDKQT